MSPSKEQAKPHFDFHPVTPERLPDLARFSEAHGKFRYCSCMRWRMRSSQFQHATKEERVAALYMGSPATFERAGLRDVTPAGQSRRVMRYYIT